MLDAAGRSIASGGRGSDRLAVGEEVVGEVLRSFIEAFLFNRP